MAKYRKKPVTIDAEQFTPAHTPEGVNFSYPTGEGATHPLTGKHWITTPNGPVEVKHGDWIVPEPNKPGLYYPIGADYFAQFYEPVEAPVDELEPAER